MSAQDIPTSNSAIHFGEFQLDAASGDLVKGGQATRLQPQQLQLLLALVEAKGRVVQRAELHKALWPGKTFVEFEDGLNHAVIRLRSALGDSAQNPRYIETVPRRGYRFIAPVSKPSVSASEDVLSPAPAHSALRTMVWALAALAVVAAGLATYFARASRDVASVHTIAVLPLVNLTGDADQQYLADAVTEEITTELARIGQLDVVSRTSAFRYQGSTKSLPEIGRELAADALIEGGVQRAGDELRITVQLVRAASDRHVWADTYEGSMRDVLALEAQATRDIAQQIRIRLNSRQAERLSHARPVAPAAYEAYQKGLQAARTWDTSHLLQAIQHFQVAVDADPNFAKAYAQLGHAHGMLGFQRGNPPDENTAKFRAATERALQLDDQLSEAHVNLGDIRFYGAWDWNAGEAEFRRAAQLDPASVEAQEHYAVCLWLLRRFDAAEQEMRRALRLDPASARLNEELGHLLQARHDRDGALRQYRRALELAPSSAGLFIAMGRLYEEAGRNDEAIAAYLHASSLQGASPESVKALAAAYDRGGLRAYWNHSLRDLLQSSRHNHQSPMPLATAYVRAGRKAEAIAQLERAYRQHIPMLIWINVSHEWEPLRSDARFRSVLSKMNLPEQ